MDLKGIMSIAGYPGLFKMVSQSKSGIIVESLVDKKRMPAFMTSKISSLEDIAIYTQEAEVPLTEVFKNIYEKEKGGEAISHQASANELKQYFTDVLPDYDQDRVYVSDIKKVINWYNTLHKNDLVKFDKKESKKSKKVEVEE
ncbi:MAG TPA: hypothetical protein DDX39_07500 [Bacteroidales bacterium]|nr:MAG: hypothetical protein A2W98_02145 [Bacteroidetes bacterium GWF2_33_38]OFY73321.1 MAG: hypothetical protein A2265_02665 [Bacteroidetes bacterium RIFOXYA12_FULL_33_9]OFY89676.1 MAG: hypothetical protein A2236_08025 [Bacteroidetes bacterium RIFOXYA2_FULL_33_7]HBF88469.1 hypothetical protein [Bacteroidales bacterium]